MWASAQAERNCRSSSYRAGQRETDEFVKETNKAGVCLQHEKPKMEYRPLHWPFRARFLLMTMSISAAPSATARTTSSTRVSSGVWPAGNPVATVGGGDIFTAQILPELSWIQLLPEATGRQALAAFKVEMASATRAGYTQTAAVVTSAREIVEVRGQRSQSTTERG